MVFSDTMHCIVTVCAVWFTVVQYPMELLSTNTVSINYRKMFGGKEGRETSEVSMIYYMACSADTACNHDRRSHLLFEKTYEGWRGWRGNDDFSW